MKKISNIIAAILVVMALAACGSSGDNSVDAAADGVATTPTPPPAPPVAKPVADATLTQVATTLVATPGETIRVTLLEASCPLFEGTQSCKRQVPMGEIGLTTDLDFQNWKVVHNGTTMAGFVQREDALYRFVPTGYETIWQTGVIEAIATLSPTATPGTSTVVVQAAEASVDKTLAVVQNEAKVQVVALPHYAPAIITATSSEGFMYSCPQTIAATGCKLERFNVTANTSMPGTEVRIYVGGNWVVGTWTNESSTVFTQVYTNYYVPPGGMVEVKASAMTGTGSVRFEEIVSWSGDKQIAPILPTGCTVVSPQYCKGG